jgi:predicted Zn finger-like uncharacterized protein
MTISTACPGCGASYTVSDTLAGKKAKCKKCGAILTIPNPASELADVPLADLAAGTPLQGLDDRAFGGDPLGPSRPLGSLPSTASPRRAAAASQGAGVPKWVWIACGAGGGGVVLLLAILIFGGTKLQ